MKVTCQFDRIGRAHAVAPLVCAADDGDWEAIAAQVYRYARPHLVSRDVEVNVDETGGVIYAGVQTAATITVTVEPDHAPPDAGG